MKLVFLIRFQVETISFLFLGKNFTPFSTLTGFFVLEMFLSSTVARIKLVKPPSRNSIVKSLAEIGINGTAHTTLETCMMHVALLSIDRAIVCV